MSEMNAGRAMDVRVATAMGRTVLANQMCAIFVEGEWSLHPSSSPDGWACYAALEPVMVDGCVCGDSPHEYELRGDESDTVTERINARTREEWTNQRARWGHTKHCLEVVPRFSTHITDSWRVIDWLGFEKCVRLERTPSDEWNCTIWNHCGPSAAWEAYADTLPHAICLAVLRAST